MEPLDVRAALVAALHADLVGPFVPDAHPLGGQEILPLSPSRWYLTGFLAPRGARAPEKGDADSEDDSLAAGDAKDSSDAGSEEPEPKRPVRFAASMGLSVFLPPGEGDAIEVEVEYADYDRVEIPIERTDRFRTGHKRVPHGPVPMTVALSERTLKEGIEVPGSRGLRLQGELGTTSMDGLEPGTRMLSLFLVNDRAPAPAPQDRDTQFAFQVRLALRFARGFRSRPNWRGEDGDDYDQRFNALNFHACVEWAVGHNTSVEPPKPVNGEVTRLVTTQLPTYEVHPVVARVFKDVTLGMAELARLQGEGLRNALLPLVEHYAAWIDEQQGIALARPEQDRTRDDLIAEARQAKERIARGIDLLTKDATVRRAFGLANTAMHVAAEQLDKKRADRRYGSGERPEWRPFQLAFVLMNLGGIADPHHADREFAELIYFPTGGGKTEAYLGLIAFALCLRRMNGRGAPHEGRGVAVLLRYTLRLLTLDQLGRAATLVCALEQLRSKYPTELGNAAFTIGLWVGGSTSPNQLKQLHEQLNDYARDELPFPLSACPWCPAPMKRENIKMLDANGKPTKKDFARAVVYCDGPSCPFSERNSQGRGLPVLFVDEQIYREVPSFIVATVDKFAMMPLLGDAGMLFGRATHLDEQGAYGVMDEAPKAATPLPEGLWPPELIVQDELHLISGPLGTMVGLYEAAVDYLSERAVDGVKRSPKVICSTATVRRAREQIKALFGRKMRLFPPRGVLHEDNFFAKIDRDGPGRLYVGVGAPGRALRAVSVRSYATVLAAAQKHFDPKGAPDQAADPYMTLIGYFNSLRELGGMRRLVEDEVRARVGDIDAKKRPLQFVGPHPWAADRRLDFPQELTSRASTKEVKETKRALAARFADTANKPIGVVLASNMISVGLDIDRLGLMVVTGQPKTTSEYIQATSRVGRAYPGLVVTCLNVMRPRDRSHYERFGAYHESFYREVEASSVTPFSAQAMDRGLVGSLLSMIRHGVRALGPPAGFMELHAERAAAEEALSWLVERVRRHRTFHDDEAETRLADHVRRRGKAFLDAWERVIDKARKGAATRTYSSFDKSEEAGKRVLYTANDAVADATSITVRDDDERRFQVPTSMRDVEPSVAVWVRFAPLDTRK